MPLKRKDKDSQQERREIQPKWPGVYETEEGWTAIEPRSNVHKHTVTLGESMDHKDYRREDWDQPEERREIQPKWPGVYETEED